MSFKPLSVVEPGQMPVTVEGPTGPWPVEIREMLPEQPSQTISQFRRERLSITPQFAAATGLLVGQQVIVRIPGHQFKAMTIGSYHTEEDQFIVRMNALAFGQFELPVEPVAATIESGPIASDVTVEEAEQLGLIVERASLMPQTKTVMVIANHGGLIEPWTHIQAERSQQRLEAVHGVGSAYYVAQGYPPPDRPPTRITSTFWHITSVDFRGDRGSWPLLATIWDERFTWALSYHGMGGEKHVGVGGLAGDIVLDGAVAAIAAVLPNDYLVDKIEEAHLDGTSLRNIMNRFAAPNYFTIQLEQTFDARRDFHEEIADALTDYLASLL